MNNIPPVPAQGSYGTLALISTALTIIGWICICLTVPLVAVVFLGNHLMISSVLNSFSMGTPITQINTTSLLMSIPPAVISFASMLFIGMCSLAGGESIRLMIDLRDDQYYSNKLLYLITTRVYERVR